MVGLRIPLKVTVSADWLTESPNALSRFAKRVRLELLGNSRGWYTLNNLYPSLPVNC
jgi:hypothetical protein